MQSKECLRWKDLQEDRQGGIKQSGMCWEKKCLHIKATIVMWGKLGREMGLAGASGRHREPYPVSVATHILL